MINDQWSYLYFFYLSPLIPVNRSQVCLFCSKCVLKLQFLTNFNVVSFIWTPSVTIISPTMCLLKTVPSAAYVLRNRYKVKECTPKSLHKRNRFQETHGITVISRLFWDKTFWRKKSFFSVIDCNILVEYKSYVLIHF